MTLMGNSSRGPRATIFFDVNETLSDLSSVDAAFERVGAGASMAATWFAGVLRDGFALTAAGSTASFTEIGENNARLLLTTANLRPGREGSALEQPQLEEAVAEVMTAFSSAGLHPDVAEGLTALHDAGHQIFTLSNGAPSTARRLLSGAGVLSTVKGVLSVEGNTLWKPTAESYANALTRTHAQRPAILVAVHPWDIHGAARAGLGTGWINRTRTPYPGHFLRPTITATDIPDFARQLNSCGGNRMH